jgi:hypothetical protein
MVVTLSSFAILSIIDAALQQLEQEGFEIESGDISRFSLWFLNIFNVLDSPT